MVKDAKMHLERVSRLKLWLIETGMSQKELADIINYTPQQVSKIMTGKSEMTEQFAKRVSEKAILKFFDNIGDEHHISVRYEWLLCWDDYKTDAEKVVKRSDEKDVSFQSALIMLDDAVKSLGMTAHFRRRDDLDDLLGEMTDAVWRNIPLHDFPHLCRLDLQREGKSVASLSGIEVKRFQKRLARQARLLIEEMIEEGEIDDGEH